MTRIFLRATVITQGWDGYQNNQHRKLTLTAPSPPPSPPPIFFFFFFFFFLFFRSWQWLLMCLCAGCACLHAATARTRRAVCAGSVTSRARCAPDPPWCSASAVTLASSSTPSTTPVPRTAWWGPTMVSRVAGHSVGDCVFFCCFSLFFVCLFVFPFFSFSFLSLSCCLYSSFAPNCYSVQLCT